MWHGHVHKLMVIEAQTTVQCHGPRPLNYGQPPPMRSRCSNQIGISGPSIIGSVLVHVDNDDDDDDDFHENDMKLKVRRARIQETWFVDCRCHYHRCLPPTLFAEEYNFVIRNVSRISWSGPPALLDEFPKRNYFISRPRTWIFNWCLRFLISRYKPTQHTLIYVFSPRPGRTPVWPHPR